MLKLSKVVTVHIPMAVELRDALKLKAQHLGFDSVQAFVRFWAQAQVEGRKVELDDEDWEPNKLALVLPRDNQPPESSPSPRPGW